MWFSIYIYFLNCEHLVLAPQLGLGWKPHIWNVYFVFPLKGEYFGVSYLLLLVSLPCCDQVPLPRRLGSHPSLGWESLVTRPTGSFCALIVCGWWKPWNLLLTKWIWVETLEQNWQEGNQPTVPSDANLNGFSPPCAQQTTECSLSIICIPSWACMSVYSVCQL